MPASPIHNISYEEDHLSKITEDFFRLMVRGIKGYALFMLTPSGIISSWNLGAQIITGYLEEEVLGNPIDIFFTEKEKKENRATAELETAATKGTYEARGLRIKKDGTVFHGNITLTTIYHDGKLIGFVKIIQDITEAVKLEQDNKQLGEHLEEKVKQRTQELEIVNKELESFSYSVSHDLRTPLRAISGYARMFQEEYESMLDAEGNRILNTIIDNTKLMGDLIDDLLTFSRMSRLEIISSSVDMKKLVSDCIGELQQINNSSRASINILAIPECKGDKAMLKQVWFNLIGNAFKYSSKKEATWIEIGSIPAADEHIYYVRDNGAGFEMQYAHKLFDVFQRLHRQDEFEGTGLGLALAKRIITKHQGEIWGQGELDKGATFSFSIPKRIL